MRAIFVGGPRHGELCESQHDSYTVMTAQYVRTGQPFPYTYERVEHVYHRSNYRASNGRGVNLLVHNSFPYGADNSAQIADAMACALGLEILGEER